MQPNPSTETTTTETWNFCAGGIFKHVTSLTDNFGAFEITTERGLWTQLAPNPNGFSVGFSYGSKVRQESDGSTRNLLATGPPVRAVTFIGGIFYLDSDAFAVGVGAPAPFLPLIHGVCPPPRPPAPPDLHLRFVLPLILALALATAAGIWFFYHVSGTAEGRCDPITWRTFVLQTNMVSNWPNNNCCVRRERLRDFARRLFENHGPGKLPDGFLSPHSPRRHPTTVLMTRWSPMPHLRPIPISLS